MPPSQLRLKRWNPSNQHHCPEVKHFLTVETAVKLSRILWFQKPFSFFQFATLEILLLLQNSEKK